MPSFPVDEIVLALDLWCAQWSVSERAAFERALLRVLVRSPVPRLRVLAWATARAIGTPALAAAAMEEERWIGLDEEELAGAIEAIDPVRRAFLAARAISSSHAVLVGAIRRAVLGRANDDELLVLELVDPSRLLSIIEDGCDALVRDRIHSLLARRGPYQRRRIGRERRRERELDLRVRTCRAA